MKLKAQGRMNVIMKVFHFVSALCIRKVSCGHVRYYSVEGVFSLQPTCTLRGVTPGWRQT
jgi:hypothetical protein